MKSLVFRAALGLAAPFLSASGAAAQQEWIDAILPPNHLLVKLPLAGGGGEGDLFTFADLSGDGNPDLVLAYRPAAALEDLKGPHRVTLAYCPFDRAKSRYTKAFDAEGPPVTAAWLIEASSGRPGLIVVKRGSGESAETKGYLVRGASVETVLDLRGTAASGTLRDEVWPPRWDAGGGTLFAFDPVKGAFIDAVGRSLARFEPLAAPAASSAGAAAKPESVKPVSRGQAPGVPEGEAGDAYRRLLSEKVPEAVAAGGDLSALGREAAAIFESLRAAGLRSGEYSDLRAGYYTAVAAALAGAGRQKEADEYLELVLKHRPDFQPAVELKKKWKER